MPRCTKSWQTPRPARSASTAVVDTLVVPVSYSTCSRSQPPELRQRGAGVGAVAQLTGELADGVVGFGHRACR